MIIRNRFIPFGGYEFMAFWPFIFVREGERFEADDENHERIHLRQQVEMLIVGIVLTIALYFWGFGWWSLVGLPLYYWWYIIEWLIRLFSSNAYRGIAFEQEAYDNEDDLDYLKKRTPFAWLVYY